MKVRVRLFARLSELAGLRETTLEVSDGATAGDAYIHLAEKYPRLSGLAGSLMYAVNAEYVPAHHPLREGDEVTFIPPVSGGACVL
ncbi:MAG TPA: molybdopterin converting factor subunit 1 [Dehalococcoidia bacterium]|nr:molybdopterin converting factor subunit 1 [Dehalococcoidia bacterium]